MKKNIILFYVTELYFEF